MSSTRTVIGIILLATLLAPSLVLATPRWKRVRSMPGSAAPQLSQGLLIKEHRSFYEGRQRGTTTQIDQRSVRTAISSELKNLQSSLRGLKPGQKTNEAMLSGAFDAIGNIRHVLWLSGSTSLSILPSTKREQVVTAKALKRAEAMVAGIDGQTSGRIVDRLAAKVNHDGALAALMATRPGADRQAAYDHLMQTTRARLKDVAGDYGKVPPSHRDEMLARWRLLRRADDLGVRSAPHAAESIYYRIN